MCPQACLGTRLTSGRCSPVGQVCFLPLQGPLRPDSHSCPATSLSLAVLHRINGHPGKTVRLAGLWKLEEVSLSRVPCCPLPELPSLLASPSAPCACEPPTLVPAVPPQRLHDGPVRADGHHHGSEANAQQLRGVSEAVRTPSPPGAAHRRESGPQDAPPPAPPPAPPGSPPASPAPRWLAHKCRSLRAPSQDPELGHWQRNYRLNPVYTFSLFNEFMEMSTRGGAGGRGAGGGAGEDAQGDRSRPQ